MSLATTTEVDDQGMEDNDKGISVKNESSGFVGTEEHEANNPPETEKAQDETVIEINEPGIEFASNAPVAPSNPPIEEGSNTRGNSRKEPGSRGGSGECNSP